jgi:hypothetical protein
LKRFQIVKSVNLYAVHINIPNGEELTSQLVSYKF